MRNAESLIHTSVTDCMTTLQFWGPDDLAELEKALQMACDLGHKSRAIVIGRRIRAIKKEAK
ncbi:MAG: hypothetical protein SCI25_00080 [Desulfuromonadales bacterium]|nr:hypothetical protein [Desulfuromonadales bacterium]